MSVHKVIMIDWYEPDLSVTYQLETMEIVVLATLIIRLYRSLEGPAHALLPLQAKINYAAPLAGLP